MKKIKTACVIDDDPIFIYGTKRMMNEVDFCEHILVYTNGLDALEGFKELKEQGAELPGVIFLDLNMPIMDGWDFLDDLGQLLQEDMAHITVYIISSSVDPRELNRVKDYKMVRNYVLKPLTPKDLDHVRTEVA
ncbi:response regulator [Flavobacteriaceae bacterium 3-367]|uniref:response regulator n=1 Tax=Eudoraea algarum TaxID=3417568 RepID=UPI00327F46B3